MKFRILIFSTCVSLFYILNHFISKELASKKNQSIESALRKNTHNKNESLTPLNTKNQLEREKFTISVNKNDTLYNIMRQLNFSSEDIHTITGLSKAFFDLKNLKIGSKIHFEKNKNEKTSPDTVSFKISDFEILNITQDISSKEWLARINELPVEYTIETFENTISNSLWESAEEIGLTSSTIFNFSSIFAWQIDFDREVRKDHSWKVLIEQKVIDQKPTKEKKILYAEYKTSDETYKAIRYPQNSKKAEYYDADGNNLKSLFLKSPIKFGRISSTFQRKRFHPILKINRPHYGIDYAAPSGTPILVVGDGVIKKKGYSRSSGNYILVRHNSMYETAYRHLKGFVRGLKKNQKVKQGQIIGYVGSTGLATGPHLHFEFHENGKFVDPLGKKFPRKAPLDKKHLMDFLKTSQNLQQRLYSSLNKKNEPRSL